MAIAETQRLLRAPGPRRLMMSISSITCCIHCAAVHGLRLVGQHGTADHAQRHHRRLRRRVDRLKQRRQCLRFLRGYLQTPRCFGTRFRYPDQRCANALLFQRLIRRPERLIVRGFDPRTAFPLRCPTHKTPPDRASTGEPRRRRTGLDRRCDSRSARESSRISPTRTVLDKQFGEHASHPSPSQAKRDQAFDGRWK